MSYYSIMLLNIFNLSFDGGLMYLIHRLKIESYTAWSISVLMFSSERRLLYLVG